MQAKEILKFGRILVVSYFALCLVVSGSNMLAAAFDRPMGEPIMLLNWPIKMIIWLGEVYERLQMII